MKASRIAQKHFEAAILEAEASNIDSETLCRYILSLVVAKYLEKRSVADVRAELIGSAENCDPATDYVFMRP